MMLKWVSEISDHQADLIKSFAIFYLIVVCNYVTPSLFTCFQVKFIQNNVLVQYLMAFFLFYFLVTVLSNTGKLEYVPPIEKLLYSVVYFVGFLLVMRLDMMLTTVVLFLIFLIYFIELNQEFYLEMGKTINDPGDKAIYENNQYWITMSWPFTIRLFPVNQSSFIFINKIETVIFYIIILFLIIGFISYGGEIKDTVNKNNNLTWIKVITDTSICKMNERKGFWEYFKIGLGLKV